MPNEYPLVAGKVTSYPAGSSACPVCGRPFGKEVPYVNLFVGCVMYDAPDRMNGCWDDRMGFEWRLKEMTTSGQHGRVQRAELVVADDVVGGQGDFYFCGTACLRSFFNRLVDDLDELPDE